MNLNLIFTTKNVRINSTLNLLSNLKAAAEALILKLFLYGTLDDPNTHLCEHENNKKEGN